MTKPTKPGPKEQLHKLPFTFSQALGAMLKAKPPAKQPKAKKKAVKKKTRP
ncbi:MAG TPA: hypothetical protein PLN21_05160 [Gemmatales bacterium]|nr:hypothetical protein [Gemmatales bacterium]